jgi:P4 family phage/plasmid primase-like protien
METNERLEALAFFTENQMDLIPLKRWNTKTTKNNKHIQMGKSPRDNNWRHKNYGQDEIKTAVEKGYNIGWRLCEEDLVLDVDPKNGGDKSLARIEQRFGVHFEDIAPTVITGSGGRHFYFDKDPSIKTREVLEDEEGKPYPGIEFKTVGRQVVIPGSRHPNGQYYEWDDFAPEERPVLRPDIFELIIRPSRKDGKASAGKLDADALAMALEQLDPCDYRDHDKWLALMMACHHATDGDGSEEFIQWSTGDADFRDHANTIRMRWDSLHTKNESAVTYKTLYQEIKKHGGKIDTLDAISDFDDDDFDAAIGVFEEGDDFSSQLERLTQKGVALTLSNDLTNESSDRDIKDAIIAAISCKSPIEKQKALAIIQKKTKLTKGALNAIIKEIEEKQLNDVGEYAAEALLNEHYAGGKHLLYVNDSDFWHYNGKYWEPHSRSIIRQKAITLIDELREKLGLPLVTSNVVHQIEFLLIGVCATDKDILRLTQEPLPVINCLNGELWIGEDGSYELVGHKYTSYLTNCLQVEYDPEAQAPLWDETIRDIFVETGDYCEDMARHFEEMMGYVLQPYKNIACWFMLKGQGANGKSLLCDMLAELAGEFALSTSIKDLDTNKNAHAFANLPRKLMVYDDDLDVTSTLPDGVLKKISERKRLEANPKNKAPFSFISVATPILLANKWPTIRDVSNGTRRRAQIIPFNRVFDKNEMDLDLARKLKADELPGILNRALEGLRRLRKRGDFDPPRPCIVGADNWLQSANTFAGFIEDCVTRTNNDKDTVNLAELFDAYKKWCHNNGVHYSLQKSHFKENLLNIGIQLGHKGQGRVRFKGIKLSIDEELFL